MQCDVTNYDDVARLITVATGQSDTTIEIIHAAGVYDDRPIQTIDWESFRFVCAPKVIGAMNLHLATLGKNLNTFCLVSSVASMLGNAGQCSYAAANSFLDGLAHFRKSKGLVSASVNFGPFEDFGFLSDKPQVRGRINRTGINFTPKHFALKAMENAMVMGLAQVGVFNVDWQRWLSQMRFKEVPDRIKAIVTSSGENNDGNTSTRIDILKELIVATPSEWQGVIEAYLCQRIANILSADPKTLDPNISLSSQGLDSLSTIDLALSIEADTKFSMTPEEFQGVQTVRSVAKLLLAKYHAMRGAT